MPHPVIINQSKLIMSVLKYIFQKIGDGFLYGIGIGAMIMAASYVSVLFWEDAMDYDDYDDGYVEFDASTALKVIEETYTKVDAQNAMIVGVIENQSENPWGSINLEVELLDKGGKLIDEFSEYIQSTLEPGDKENFKLDISYCEKNELPEFDRYTLRIVDAYSGN